MIGSWILASRLAAAITGADVPLPVACSAAVAIVATHGSWPVELIAAIAYGESRYQPAVVNARTGTCGPLQVATTPRRCAWLRLDARRGYAAGVLKLDQSAAYCARRGDARLLCVLAGYRSGPAGVRGRWYRGPRAVMRRAARIRRTMATIGGVA
jgi:hypothetical protein